MTRSGQFLYNFFVNLVTSGVSSVLGIISVPFLIIHLGTEEFGLTVLFSSAFGIASIFEVGMNTSVMRKLSLCAAQSDVSLYNKTFNIAMTGGIILTILFTGGSYFFASQIISLFPKISESLVSVSQEALWICIFNSSVNAFILPVILGVYASRHRFDLIAIYRTAIISFQVLIWFLVLSFSDCGLVGWAIGGAVVTCCVTFISYTYSKKIETNLLLFKFEFERKLFKELFLYGGKVSVIKISIFAITYLNPILFSIYGAIIYNTIFQTSTKGSALMSTLLGNISGQIVPHAAELIINKDKSKMREVYLTLTNLVFSFSVFILLAAITSYDYIFYIWIHSSMPDYWGETANLFILLLFVQIIASPSEVQWPILMVIGKINNIVLFYAIRTILSIAFTIVLLTHSGLGVYSVIAVNLPVTAITIFFFMYELKKEIGVSMISQFVFIFGRGLICALITLPVLLFIKNFIDTSLTNVLLKLLTNVSLSIAILTPVFYFLGLSKQNRTRLNSAIGRITQKLCIIGNPTKG